MLVLWSDKFNNHFHVLGMQVVVVLMQDRVDRRRLAQVLGVRAAGVRLAPLEELPLICGFPGETASD